MACFLHKLGRNRNPMNSNSQPPPVHSNPIGWIALFVGMAALHLAREVCIPLALAVLIAFLLGPLADVLEKLHLGRVGSALAAVIIALVLAGFLTEAVAWQLGDLGKKLPEYEANIHKKLQAIESSQGRLFGHAEKSMKEFRRDLTPTNSINLTTGTNGVTREVKPVPVEVREPQTSPLHLIQNFLGPLMNLLASLFLVTLLCIFILAARDDLQARLIRIAGSRKVKLTSQVMDEVGRRLSRYLLMQLIVNTAFGVPIGLGLWLLGIPNPMLWGMMASLLRYIPYAGSWLAAFMPFAIGVAMNPGWGKPFAVLALFATVEILTANLIEPWLYGHSTGITPLAVILGAVFWTWIWGPVGLLLSTPLTVCLVSIARYVPQMALLEELFGEAERDKPNRNLGRWKALTRTQLERT